MKSLQIIFLFFFLCIQTTGYNQVYKVDINYVTAWKKIDSLRRHRIVKESFSLNKKKNDSLQRLIALFPDDTAKVNRLLLVSSIQMESGRTAPTTAFAIQALTLAEKLHFKKIFASIYKELGDIYAFRKDFKTAIKYFQQALNLSGTDAYNSKSIDLYAVLLNSYFYLADYPHAMETISREMAIAEKINDKSRIAHCNNILGYIYFKQENFKESEKYYGHYINNAKELNDSILLAHALGEMADAYISEKKYVESINILFTTLRICDQLFLDRGTIGTETNYKAKALYRLSRAYKLKGDLPKALHYSLETFKLVPVYFTEYEIASYYINAGDVYKELKEYKKAVDYLSYGFTLSKKIQHRENTRDAAEYLSQVYALQYRYDSAFFYYRIFTGLKDSIVNNETKMKIVGIQGQYDVAKKDKEIIRQQQIRNTLIASFIILLIVLLFLYNGYRLRQKNKYQKELNHQQNELFNAIVTTQDQERKRIAQDIHDSLGSVLSAAKLKLSSLEDSKQRLSPDQLEKYQASLSLLDEAATELRNISYNIMPVTLSKLGIVAALQSLIDKLCLHHTGLHISFIAHAFDTRLEETTEISIYRIIMELINNIVKHAMADKATIQLIKYPDYINLMIEDNGLGFNYEKALEEKKGIGLGNVLSRVEYLKGTIAIDSSGGEGTTIIIDIPYKS